MTKRGHLKVLLTDAECSSALACVRSLGRAGYEVYALGSEDSPPASASRYIKGYFRVVSPWESGEIFVSQLFDISRQVSPHYILPISEAAVFFLSRVQVANCLNGRLLIPSPELLDLGHSKILTYKRGFAENAPLAPGCVLECGDHSTRSSEFPFPVVVRTDNRLNEDGRYQKGRTWIARSAEELDAIRLEQGAIQQPLLVQKFIEGLGAGCFLLVWKGEVVCWHSHIRLAEIPWQGGVSARRELAFNKQLLSLSQKILSGSAMSGIAMVEFRMGRSEESKTEYSEPYLVEINARPWGSMALSVHANIPFVPLWIELLERSQWSQDPAQLKEHHVHLPKPPGGLVCTSLYPGEVQHLSSVLQSVIRREMQLRDAVGFFVRSLKCILHPKTTFDYLFPDDPLPALSCMSHGLKKQLNRLLSGCVNRISNHLQSFLLRMVRLIHLSESDLPHSKSRKNILVICYGNRCRSPFLERLLQVHLKDTQFQIWSRGLVVSETTVPARFHGIFEAQGIKPMSHLASEVTKEDVQTADKIVVMERWHAFLLAKRFGWRLVLKCVLPWHDAEAQIEVADPFVLNPIEAARVFDDLSHRAQVCARRFSQSISGLNLE